jgi:hypothetical protein
LLVEIPAHLTRKRYTRAILHSYDRPPETIPVLTREGAMAVRVPELKIWAILEFLN